MSKWIRDPFNSGSKMHVYLSEIAMWVDWDTDYFKYLPFYLQSSKESCIGPDIISNYTECIVFNLSYI